MTWNIGGAIDEPEAVQDVVRGKLDQLAEDNPDYRDPFATDEAREQLDVAMECVVAITEGGAVGAGPWRFSLIGHANASHEPDAGATSDYVSVSVSKV